MAIRISKASLPLRITMPQARAARNFTHLDMTDISGTPIGLSSIFLYKKEL
jgi:hypothetical protein